MWLGVLFCFPFSVILQALRPWTIPFPSLTPLHKALASISLTPLFPLWFMLFDLLAGPETLISFPHWWAVLVNTPWPYSCSTKLTHWARMDSGAGNYRLEPEWTPLQRPWFFGVPEWLRGRSGRTSPSNHWHTSRAYKHTHCFLRVKVRNLTVPQSCYWSCLWKFLWSFLSSCYVSGTFHDSFLSILTRLLGRRYYPILQMKKLKIGKIKWPTIKDWRQASNPGLPGTTALPTLEGSLCRTKLHSWIVALGERSFF